MLLSAPLFWIGVVYLGSLLLLFRSSFWHVDFGGLSPKLVKEFSFQNFEKLWNEEIYRTIAVRTVTFAALTAVIDVILAFPLAYFASRVVGRRSRTFMLFLLILPLWTSYLVRVYAWRIILADDGPLNWLLGQLGLSAHISYSNTALLIVFCYLWLPFVILPIYASLERVPQSLIDASSDLGARGYQTFRQVTLPLALPGVVAGSIFAFSLTLGDYIAPDLAGNTQFIGNVVYRNSLGLTHDLPFAAAYSIVPVVIMIVYLGLIRRTGALENL